jgi:hypothetical protein
MGRCAPAAFEKVRVSRGGFCAPAVDCSSFIELLGDGTIRVNVTNEPSNEVHEGKVDAADLAAAATVLTDPALLSLLDGGEPPCSTPTDIFESLAVTVDGVEHQDEITFCQLAPIAAARKKLDELAAEALAD